MEFQKRAIKIGHMFLGIDASTQSLTAVVLDGISGEILAQQSVNFGADLPEYGCISGFLPNGKNGEVHSPPAMWLDALDMLLEKLNGGIDLSKIEIICGSGQQHGTVYLDGTFDARLAALRNENSLASQLTPALTRATSPIWMDNSTGSACAEISEKMGGAHEVCRISGSIAIERFSGPQIRRFYQTDAAAYERTERIHLVSSFMGSVLLGRSMPIDLGDGAGMNLLNLAEGRWDENLLDATAPELAKRLLAPMPAGSLLGSIHPYFQKKYGFSNSCQIATFTGDNPASLVGMGATLPGQVVISLGTSDTYFAAMPQAVTDPQGFGHVFGNPAGGFMSLICFRNGSLAREAMRDAHRLDWSAFEKQAMLASSLLAGRNLMLPFYQPEITPRCSLSEPIFDFETDADSTAQVRALVESQFLNMRLHSQWLGVEPERILLTGGASRNDGIAQIIADVFQVPVERLEVANSAALGAALLAAAAGGQDLSSLQACYCQPENGSRLLPNTALAPIYQQALARYRELLAAHAGE